MNSFLVSKSLEGKLSPENFFNEKNHDNLPGHTLRVDDNHYKIIAIDVLKESVVITIEAELSFKLLKPTINVDGLTIGGIDLNFQNPVLGKFSNARIKDSINLNTCSIVIGENTFWEKVKNV